MEIDFEYANNFKDGLINKTIYHVRNWLGPMFPGGPYYIEESKIEYIRLENYNRFMVVFYDKLERYLNNDPIGKLFTDKAEAEAYCEYLNGK